MGAFILTMVITMSGGSSYSSTSFTVEYSSKQKCEDAKTSNRAALSNGSVILATCTAK